MRRLTLIRHAKSSHQDPGLDDFDRPLNARGRRDAPEMGRRLAAANARPDLIVSSPAERAARTSEAIAEPLGYAASRIVFDRALYLASSGGMLEVTRALDDGSPHAALVGHNPGLTEFVNVLSDAAIENVPTSGIVRLELDVDHWREAGPGCAKLIDFDYPKR